MSDEGVIIHVLYRTGPKRKTKGKENLLLVPWSQRSFLGGWGGWGSPPVDSSKKLATGRKYASSPRKQEAAFRGGSLCDAKINCCVRRLPRASVVWDLTNKKIVSLSLQRGLRDKHEC